MDSAHHAGFEEGGRRPQVKERQWPREGEKARQQILPGASREEHSPRPPGFQRVRLVVAL